MSNPLIGSGQNASVYQVVVDGKSRAQKTGTLGPYEVTVLQSGSKFVPTLISHTPNTLTMKLAPGSVCLDPKNAHTVTKFLCSAVLDVSEKCGIELVHRDIKPENIGITKSGNLKLFDWGSAIPAGTIPTTLAKTTYVPEGTPGYLPPEGYFNETPITVKFDSWAIGIVLYQLLSGKPHPIQASSIHSLNGAICMMAIEEPELPAIKTIRIRTTNAFNTALTQITSPEPLKTVLCGLLEIDPEKRLSPKDALTLLNSFSEESSSHSPASITQEDSDDDLIVFSKKPPE